MQYFLPILTPILTFLLGYLSTEFQKSKQRDEETIKREAEEQHVMCEAIRALLKDRITSIYYSSIEKKYCQLLARENLEDMYEQYTALDGNGTITDLHNKIMQLPTEPPKESNEKQ